MVVGARAQAICCAVDEACELAASVLGEGFSGSCPRTRPACKDEQHLGGVGGEGQHAERRGRVSFIWSLPAPFAQESSVANSRP